jgi:hypothetical protein
LYFPLSFWASRVENKTVYSFLGLTMSFVEFVDDWGVESALWLE